jgi:hypothetical protein
MIDNAHCEVIRTFYEEKVRDVNGVADFVQGKFDWRKAADLLAYRHVPFRKLFLRDSTFAPGFSEVCLHVKLTSEYSPTFPSFSDVCLYPSPYRASICLATPVAKRLVEVTFSRLSITIRPSCCPIVQWRLER